MGKLIKLHPTPEWIERGNAVLDSLSDEAGTAIVAVVTSIIIQDVRAGLAGTLEEKSPVFEVIDQEYKNRAGQCYFCNKEIDPNEAEFNLDTHICLFCMLKVANILEACGVDPQNLFPKIGSREVQKTKL